MIRRTSLLASGLGALGLIALLSPCASLTSADDKPAEVVRPFIVSVVNTAGKPIAGASVRLSSSRDHSQSKTNAHGEVILLVPQQQPEYFNLHASADRHVPLTATWRKAGDRSTLPAVYKFTLEPGTTIGGIVRNEDGQPVSGVKVSITVPSLNAEEPGKATVAIWDHVVTTDKDGRWKADIVPKQLDDVYLRLAHEAYASDSSYGETPRPPLEQLRDGTGVMVIKRGLQVTGRVVADNDQPVANAVVAQGEDRFGTNYPTTRTDAEGRFAFGGCRPGRMTLTIVAEGHAPELTSLNVTPELKPIDVRLKPGRTIKVKVVDAAGKPVAGVYLAPDTWRGCRTLTGLGLPRETDREGVWTWAWAPDDAILFDILKQGYMDDRGHSLSPADELQVVTLRPPLRVSGSVVDAETKRPVGAFRVVRGLGWDQQDRIHWEQESAVTLQGGRYEQVFSYPYPKLYVRIEADGYLAGVSRAIKATEGNVTFDFELKKGKPLAGRVVGPDGEPRAGAQVLLVTRDSGAYLRGGRTADRQNAPAAETGADGTFRFPPQSDPFLFVAFDDAGYAEVRDTELTDDALVKLAAWARVDGELRIGSSAAGAGESLWVSLERPYDPNAPSVYHHLEAKTDAAGKFAFDRVPPGGVGSVARAISSSPNMTSYTHSVRVSFAAGETHRVTIGGTGRPVVGRFVSPEGSGEPPPLNFGHFSIALNVAEPQLPEDLKTASPEEQQKWWIAYAATPEYQELQAKRRWYSFKVEADGRFRAEDIPAGDYQLSAQFMPPPTPSRGYGGEIIASANRMFTIDELPGGRSDEPLDLGDVELMSSQRLTVPRPPQ